MRAAAGADERDDDAATRAACRESDAVFRNGGGGSAHGVVPEGVATFLGRLPRRCGAGDTSTSEVDRRGALKRPSAQEIRSPKRYKTRGPNRR